MAEVMEENVEFAYYSITTRWSASGWEHLLIRQGAGVPRERVVARIDGDELLEDLEDLVAHANAHIESQQERKLAQEEWRIAASG